LNTGFGYGIHSESTRAIREQAAMRASVRPNVSSSSAKKMRSDVTLRDGRMFREVCHVWEEQIKLEKEIELLKCQLANRSDFSCMAAFATFDYRNLGCLASTEFVDCMQKYIGMGAADPRLSTYLFIRHDSDMDGRINYGEFCRLIVPKINADLGTRLLDRSPIADRLSYETHELFRRLLLAHLNLESGNNRMREKLNDKLLIEGWCLSDLFRILDENNIGNLTDCALECFLIENRRSGSRHLVTDIELLISLYERGHSKARAISYLMFEDQLTPKYIA
jgi:Ca2+-binding EF-hand superfamily protein